MEIHNKLEQIKKRLEKATPGPWRIGISSTHVVVSDYPVPEIGGSDATDYFGGHLIGESISTANADFIANSWADIKFLLDQIQIRECPRCKNTDISPNDNFCTICGLKLAKEHKNNVNHL